MAYSRIIRSAIIKQIRNEKLFDNKDHVLIAFSGGYDSMHLLNWLISDWIPSDIKPKVSVLYVNHMLRQDSEEEEKFVENIFNKVEKKIQFSKIVRLKWDINETGIEEKARNKRYKEFIEFSQEKKINKILTAHHKNDQIETIFYKMIRGGYLSQLKGIMTSQNYTDDIKLVRPLLNLNKNELKYLVDIKISSYIEDYTNKESIYNRNNIRNEILPRLHKINDKTGENILKLSQQLEALEQLAQENINNKISKLENSDLNWDENEIVLVIILQNWLNKQKIYNVKNNQLIEVIKMMKNKNKPNGQINISKNIKIIKSRKKIYIQL